ncbi:hypothetical protein [Gorillibacterium timonense]|uniref:hypothetical protein n=1 Tax=Gorillibacterium timonense TaxID=1689269 RepID=UPI00071E65C0|nr:hypothetical protein [Gorillibacterium timonense]
MIERTEALTVLGLAGEAGEEEIESKYLLLAKRHKNKGDDEPSYPGGPIFSKVTEAYHALTGYRKLEVEVYEDLSRREKLNYVFEHYGPEIGFSVCLVVLFLLVGYGIFWLASSF